MYFQSTKRLQNLFELRRAHFNGNSGKSGKGGKGHGNDARDIRFSVPLGTEIHLVKRAESGSTDRNNRIL